MISIDRYLVFKWNITELFESCHYGKELFISCGIILLVDIHLSCIESDGLAILVDDCTNIYFGSTSMYLKRSIEVQVGQKYFTSYHTFDGIKIILVLVFPVLFDVFGG